MNTQRLKVEPAPWVANLAPYQAVTERKGVDLRLDANEGTAPAKIVGDLVTKTDVDLLARYPSTKELEGLLAKTLRVDPETVLVTGGVDDALDRALRAVCAPGRDVVVTTPSFEMYRRAACLAGGRVKEVAWWSGEYPVDEVCRVASDRTAAVTAVSPNNPTGAVISRSGLERLLDRLPGALVLVDHAYVEFADEDLTATALSRPNGLVFRTFSKAWGCAGLRVGYAVGDSRVVTWLRSAGQPYPVSTLSLVAVARILEGDGDYRRAFVEAVRQERETLSDALRDLGAAPLPSQGNFVLARIADATAVQQGLARRGISVRWFSHPESLRSCLRISLPGDKVAFNRLLVALRDAVLEARGGECGRQE